MKIQQNVSLFRCSQRTWCGCGDNKAGFSSNYGRLPKRHSTTGKGILFSFSVLSALLVMGSAARCPEASGFERPAEEIDQEIRIVEDKLARLPSQSGRAYILLTHRLFSLYAHKEDYAKSEELRLKLLLYLQHLPPSDETLIDIAATYVALGAVCSAQHQRDRAEKFFLQAVWAYDASSARTSDEYGRQLVDLGSRYEDWGQREAALYFYRRGVDIFKRTRKEDDKSLVLAKESLERLQSKNRDHADDHLESQSGR